MVATFIRHWLLLGQVLCVLVGLALPGRAAELRVLFLGDQGHHQPRARFAQLQPVLARRGVQLVYTDRVTDLNAEVLADYDALLLYANIDRIEPREARALLDYVAAGHGFVPLHCASYCFRNSDEVVALMGGQFLRHGTGVFRTEVAAPEHPIMQGYGGFESWDETYVHHLHNEKDRTVLEYRVEGERREPWSWVRTHGKGRVFYTAWGHDARTWGNPGFQNLVERGIRWASGNDPGQAGVYRDPAYFEVPPMTPIAEDAPPFDYVDVGPKIPNYTPTERWGTQGRPLTQMQKPLPAEQSLQHYSAPQGLAVKLFADETQLASKPIAMNWDERGRLWLCETVDYPNELAEGNRGRDRIEIAEDSDGDGRADRFTLFAESLSIPTAILPLGDACIVQNGTETLYLADTDGDGRADLRKVLISNWALGDTHGGVSNFRLGLDNWVYAMQGYNNSTPVVEGRPQQTFRMGFWRFRLATRPGEPAPHVAELEFLRSTNNNTWGLGISEEGLIFGSTANRNPSVYLPIPNRYYERVRGWGPQVLGTIADTYLFKPISDRVRQVDQHGGYTAGCGHALYTARNYPQSWWNRAAFVCGPTGKLVGTFALTPEGADFRSTSPLNLVASDDEWAAPIMAEVGPDGNVWVLDWYNFVVQHNPTPQGFQTGKGNAYESDLRDKRHGRIYRLVTAGEGESGRYVPRQLAGASPVALVEALSDPTMLVRQHAQRLLVAQPLEAETLQGKTQQAEIVARLVSLVADRSQDAIGLNAGAIHAIWTLQGLGQLDRPGPALVAVRRALQHPSAGVRRNAVQALPASSETLAAVLAAELVRDPHPQVRLAAYLSLADQVADERAGQLLARQFLQGADAEDRWIPEAMTSAAAVHASFFLEALAGAEELSGKAAPAAAPGGAKLMATVGIVAEHVGRGPVELDAALRLLERLGGSSPEFNRAVLDGLARGWSRPGRDGEEAPRLSDAQDARLGQLLTRYPDTSRPVLIRIGLQWGSREMRRHLGEITDSLLAAVEDEGQSLETRLASARQLIQLDPTNGEIAGQLLEVITPQAEPRLATGLVGVLGGSTASDFGQRLMDQTRKMSPQVRQAALATLLGRPQTTKALLDGLDAGQVQLSDLSLDQQRALSDHPDAAIRGRARQLLARGGGLPNPDRQRVVEELLPLTQQKGDPANGLAVFKKHCSKCHRHGAIGEDIGPNLTGMAVHPKAELLVHVMDPSRSVEGNFRLYTLLLVDGRILSGMLASESRTAVELIDTQAKRFVIQRADIEELVSSTKSLMPEGFEKQLSPQELTDLLEFLTTRGRFTPLDLRKQATIVSTRGMFYSEDSVAERLIFADWSPKTFQGVPFQLVDPQGGRVPNVVLLNGPNGKFPPQMPKSVSLPCNAPVRAIHLLSGVSGWGAKQAREQRDPRAVSMIVRVHYADGKSEDHPLYDGRHFADYIGRFDVPESTFAFALRDQQLRYLAVHPNREAVIERIELVKGNDRTAPLVVAVTLEH